MASPRDREQEGGLRGIRALGSAWVSDSLDDATLFRLQPLLSKPTWTLLLLVPCCTTHQPHTGTNSHQPLPPPLSSLHLFSLRGPLIAGELSERNLARRRLERGLVHRGLGVPRNGLPNNHRCGRGQMGSGLFSLPAHLLSDHVGPVRPRKICFWHRNSNVVRRRARVFPTVIAQRKQYSFLCLLRAEQRPDF